MRSTGASAATRGPYGPDSAVHWMATCPRPDCAPPEASRGCRLPAASTDPRTVSRKSNHPQPLEESAMKQSAMRTVLRAATSMLLAGVSILLTLTPAGAQLLGPSPRLAEVVALDEC